MISKWIRDIRVFWDYITYGQFGDAVPSDTPPAEVKVRVPEETDTRILYPGKIIGDSSLKCEVVVCQDDDFRVKILEIKWDRLGTYVDVGQTYPLRSCYHSSNGDMLIWEIKPETMKRQTSQVLLAWERNVGWSWDLDF